MSRASASSRGPARIAVVATCLAIMVGIPLVHAAACNLTVRLVPGTILLYAGLRCLAVVGAAMVVAGCLVVSRWRHTSWPQAHGCVIGAGILSTALTLSFFFLVPVTLDRSISTFLLSRLEAADPAVGMTVADLSRVFEDEYLGRHAAIRRRMEEQMAGGTVQAVGGDAFALSPTGQRALRWARAVAGAYGVKDTYVRAVDAVPAVGTRAAVESVPAPGGARRRE